MMDIRSLIDHEDYRLVASAAGLDLGIADRIIASRLAGCTPSDQPRILHTMGIPGAGKSTYIAGLDHRNQVLISFDDIMEDIPDYQYDKIKHGIEAAFARWELCARAIGYELLFQAAEHQLNMIFDNSGSRPDHVPFLQALKDQFGYRVAIHFFSITEELALQRAALRERFLPPHYIPDRKQKIEALLPAYQALADEYEVSYAT